MVAPAVVDLAPKRDLFGVGVSITTYEDATARIIQAAKEGRSYGVSALAVHGLMEAVDDAHFRSQVNDLELVTPDGQPVRWALNLLHRVGMKDRVYGPDLTWHVLGAAARDGIGVYLFGSTAAVCAAFRSNIELRFPTIRIVGEQPDRFREATPDEDAADVARMNDSGAGVVLVGRGCPRQEKWVAAHRGRVNAAMLAVGAAFDYGAGHLSPPPVWVQRVGLQWLFRLGQDPARLWRRYLVTNTKFIGHLLLALGRRAGRVPSSRC